MLVVADTSPIHVLVRIEQIAILPGSIPNRPDSLRGRTGTVQGKV
jgi:hypothetical protein